MPEFKNQWDVAMAMTVLQNPDADSRLWAEAVKWLLLFGPPEVRDHIAQSSGFATGQCYPDLKPEGFTEGGDPCYSLSGLAQALGIRAEEAAEMLADLEKEQAVKHLFGEEDVRKLQ